VSWNGTVRCGWCYESGHNKRSCPQLKEHVEQNPDSYYAKIETRKRANTKKRRCTYCNLTGHNRRTCERLANDQVAWIDKAKTWRLAWAEWMAEAGIGPGALVEVETGWSSKGIKLVKGFSWASLNHEVQQTSYPHQSVRMSVITKLGQGSGWTVALPRREGLVGTEREGGSKLFNVVGPVKVTAEQILALAPPWFVKGTDGAMMKEVFDKDRTHVDHYDNGFES